jgi:23S rRNA (adenine2503-C2)-methyltransferase
VNDGDDELDGIVRLQAGKYAIMNMIPYNTVDGLPFRRPAWDKAAAIARSLHHRAPSCAGRPGRTWMPAAGS